jgi:hypothetical protein
VIGIGYRPHRSNLFRPQPAFLFDYSSAAALLLAIPDPEPPSASRGA